MLMAHPSPLTAEHQQLPVRVKDPSVPTHPWTYRHDNETARRYVGALREWASVDWTQVYEDVDLVLHGEAEMSHHAAGPSAPTPLRRYTDTEEVIERLRRALKLLVARAERDQADQKQPAIAYLIDQVRTLRAQEVPSTPEQLLGLTRKLAAVTMDLVEHLEQTGTVRGLFEC